MKTLKRILTLLLVLSLAVALAACGGGKCTSHKDSDGDGLCETCGKEVKKDKPTAKDLTLIEDGEANFQIVIPDNPDIDLRLAANNIKTALSKLGITIQVVEESDGTAQECEVLFGNITTRGEDFVYDEHRLGIDGYVITIVGSKVIVNGGSFEKLLEAIEEFGENILGLNDDTEELDYVVMSTDQIKEVIQSDYSITSITVGGADIKDFTIATNINDKTYREAAESFQYSLYKATGIWLEIVPLSEKTDKCVIIEHKDIDSTPQDSFRINVVDTTLCIETEYDNALITNLDLFVAKNISIKEGDLSFSGKLYTKDVSTVTYEEFGAKGDGRTNDFAAIKAAHDYANISGQTVIGKSRANYYISSSVINGRAETITIMTNCDWKGANFTIDDTNLSQIDAKEQYSKPIFTVSPRESAIVFSGSQLNALNASGKFGPNSKKFDLGLGYSAMLVVENKDHRVYVRYGNGYRSNGHVQSEIVCIDEDGNVIKGTELMLDYDKITSITAYRTDIETITLKNATFTTMATRVDTTPTEGTVYKKYFQRGLEIGRSNTIIDTITHKITGEFTPEEHANQGLTGACYRGFYSTQTACNVTYKNCYMTARRYYGINGTYGISATSSNNVKFENCEQINYYLLDADGKPTTIPSMIKNELTGERTYWGLGGSSYCKNLVYDNCKFTRYDAHDGLYNGKIINSKVAMINLVGGGEMYIENSVVESGVFFNLRDDYGSTWKGTVIIKNSTLDYQATKNTAPRIASTSWTNHDFGYTCYFPNIVIDNLSLISNMNFETFYIYNDSKGSDPNQESLTSWGDKISQEGLTRPNSSPEWNDVENKVNVNPYVAPKFIVVKNNLSGINFKLVSDGESTSFFGNTEIRGISGYPDYNADENIENQ